MRIVQLIISSIIFVHVATAVLMNSLTKKIANATNKKSTLLNHAYVHVTGTSLDCDQNLCAIAINPDFFRSVHDINWIWVQDHFHFIGA